MSSADNNNITHANSLDPDQAGKTGSKLFDTQMVFLKEFFEKVDFEKNQRTTKKYVKLPSMQRVHVQINVLFFVQR